MGVYLNLVQTHVSEAQGFFVEFLNASGVGGCKMECRKRLAQQGRNKKPILA